jgi:alpha-glucosidase (family GH31 glycosyl hydrolase)
MRLSIPGMMLFNIFGVPHYGSDVCGFDHDTKPELCARWIQLGAFYPFTRNHNVFYSLEQEFYKLGDTVIAAAQNSLKVKYMLMKYMYHLFIM